MSDLIKKAIEVIQTFDKRVRQPHFPNAANRMSSSIKLDAATSLAKAMELGARHGALSNTRVELNGTKLNDIGARVKANPRNSASYKRNFTNPYGKVVDNMNEEGEYSIDEEGNLVKSFEGPKFEGSQEFGDAYHTTADNVWLPSGNPGVMMHELGHAIDFNEYPKDSFMRRGMASTYKALAPTLWTEHAAWRKGKDRLLTGAAKSKLNPELLVKTLEQAARTRPMGLGSYWGKDIGGVLGAATGGAAGLAGGLLLSDSFGNSRGSVRAAGRLTGLGLLLGGALGAVGGASLGSSWGKSYGEKDSLGDEKAVQKYMNEYARAYSREYNVPQDEALRQIEALRETIKAKVKNKQTAGAKSMGSLQKAAEFGALMGKLAASASKPGLWANIRAKKARGESTAKPGDKDYPDSKNWDKVTAISEKKAAAFGRMMGKRAADEDHDFKVGPPKNVYGGPNNRVGTLPSASTTPRVPDLSVKSPDGKWSLKSEDPYDAFIDTNYSAPEGGLGTSRLKFHESLTKQLNNLNPKTSPTMPSRAYLLGHDGAWNKWDARMGQIASGMSEEAPIPHMTWSKHPFEVLGLKPHAAAWSYPGSPAVQYSLTPKLHPDLGAPLYSGGLQKTFDEPRSIDNRNATRVHENTHAGWQDLGMAGRSHYTYTTDDKGLPINNRSTIDDAIGDYYAKKAPGEEYGNDPKLYSKGPRALRWYNTGNNSNKIFDNTYADPFSPSQLPNTLAARGRTIATEAGAVFNELGQSARAFKDVTGKHMEGDYNFSPEVSMSNRELGELAKKYKPSDLNSPAGQLWLRRILETSK